jgi:hypothetical protein
MKTHTMKKIIISLLVLSQFLQTDILAQEVMHVQNGTTLKIEAGASIILAGGITLENGSLLFNAGTITLKSGATGDADFIDNTGTGNFYQHGTGKLLFSGTGNHGVHTVNLFEQITMDCDGLDLTTNITANKWYLVNGIINTGTRTAIVTGTDQFSIEADPANPNFSKSWFNGNLKRSISPATTNTYQFPVGNSTRVNIARLDNLMTTPLNNVTSIDASFGPKPGNDAGLLVNDLGTPYTIVNNGGVWHITPDVEPTTGKYDLILNFNGFTGLADNSFGIISRLNNSSNAADWKIPAGSILPQAGLPGRIVSGGFARRNKLSEFSQFGIAMALGPLPVNLTDFLAERTSKEQVALDWETASEQNSKGFEIERRADNVQSFTFLKFVSSLALNGNSSATLQYHVIDSNSLRGVTYYRLKQVDLDNNFRYSMIRAVSGLNDTRVTVKIYPNPNRGQFSIQVDGSTADQTVQILNEEGQMVRKLKIDSQQNNLIICNLSAGLYYIRIPNVFGKGSHFSEKVLIIK